MAELGVISGSLGMVSLAIQVAESVKKVKGFLDSVKEAPEEIRYILRQIEALGLVLSNYDTEEDEGLVSEAVSASIETSKTFLIRAAEALEIVVKDLEIEMKKGKKMGSFKAVLKQNIIDRLRQRLRDAQDLLVLSNQYYSQVLQRRRHDMQMQWAEMQAHKLSNLEAYVTQFTEACTSENVDALSTNADDAKSTDCKQLARTYKKARTSLKSPKRVLARLGMPSWLKLTSLCLDLCGQRSLCGMSIDVKISRSVDYYAPIMEYARKGNVRAIQEMFSKGTASPYDMIERRSKWGGATVMEMAARGGRVDVCRLLLENGARQDARAAYHAAVAFSNPLQDPEIRLELVRTFTNVIDDDEFFDIQAPTSAAHKFYGESTVLIWILNNVIGYSYQTSTMEDRTRLAINLCTRTAQPRAASLVRCLLPEPQAIAKMCHYKGKGGKTLIYSCAWALGEQTLRATQTRIIRPGSRAGQFRYLRFRNDFNYDSQIEAGCLQDLMSLMKELVLAGSDLHECGRGSLGLAGETPLSAMISSFSYLSYLCMENRLGFRGERGECYLPIPAITDILKPVMIWLELLYDTGTDLMNYGRKEKELHQEGRTTSFWRFPVWQRRPIWQPGYFYGMPSKIFSISFEFGPKPSDWQFWIIEEMDSSLEEFWDMVDQPERAMPGAWDERFDDSD